MRSFQRALLAQDIADRRARALFERRMVGGGGRGCCDVVGQVLLDSLEAAQEKA